MTSVPRCVLRHLARSRCRSRADRGIWAGNSRPSLNIIQFRRQLHASETSRAQVSTPETKPRKGGVSNVSAEARKEILARNGFSRYPRMPEGVITIREIERLYSDKAGTGFLDSTSTEDHTVFGRIKSIRFAGNSLAFADIEDQQSGHRLQVIINRKYVAGSDAEIQSTTFIKDHMKTLRPGDSICATGKAFRNQPDQLSLMTSSLPTLLSPCLHPIPTSATSENADIAVERHAQQLADSQMLRALVSRSMIINGISAYLINCGFAAVQTPILAASAGGATARPFTTTASEFSDRELSMRIAPELWLKRLIIGGMTRIFEIGQSFRNEGIDAMHNPEFTTCEFYTVDWNLKDMLHRTQNMFTTITRNLNSDPNEGLRCHSSWTKLMEGQDNDWPTIDFIPALNEALGPELSLPDLSSPSARNELLAIFEHKELPLPTMPTLPRLLDALCSNYLEPRCTTPTWIKNTPECLSPLAKSMPHPDLPHQQVAIRAELFINGHEVVNCYEEENDPEEQKRKFGEQQLYARLPSEDSKESTSVDLEVNKVDHEYIRALEWGLPPIGGWGCGIDRLAMLMLGQENIRDVLAFGNLRMVTRGASKISKSE